MDPIEEAATGARTRISEAAHYLQDARHQPDVNTAIVDTIAEVLSAVGYVIDGLHQAHVQLRTQQENLDIAGTMIDKVDPAAIVELVDARLDRALSALRVVPGAANPEAWTTTRDRVDLARATLILSVIHRTEQLLPGAGDRNLHDLVGNLLEDIER